MEILLLMIERPGEVITREEIRQRLWKDGAPADVDAGISTAMRKLRDALRDSAENPRFIETLPTRGFRFIAAVTTEEPVAAPRRLHWRWIVAAIAVAVLVAGAVVVLRQRAPAAAAAIVPFENITGDPSQKPAVDGLTKRLASNLHLRVIPRVTKDVDKIVTGSVSRTGISVQLIRSSTGEVIWARTYQSEETIARDVESQLFRHSGGN